MAHYKISSERQIEIVNGMVNFHSYSRRPRKLLRDSETDLCKILRPDMFPN